MHGLALIYILRDLRGVKEFKIVQEDINTVRILLVAEEYAQAMENSIRAGIRARLGQGVNVIIEQVSEIPKEASGKFRYVVSHIAPQGSNASGGVAQDA